MIHSVSLYGNILKTHFYVLRSEHYSKKNPKSVVQRFLFCLNFSQKLFDVKEKEVSVRVMVSEFWPLYFMVYALSTHFYSVLYVKKIKICFLLAPSGCSASLKILFLFILLEFGMLVLLVLFKSSQVKSSLVFSVLCFISHCFYTEDSNKMCENTHIMCRISVSC